MRIRTYGNPDLNKLVLNRLYELGYKYSNLPSGSSCIGYVTDRHGRILWSNDKDVDMDNAFYRTHYGDFVTIDELFNDTYIEKLKVVRPYELIIGENKVEVFKETRTIKFGCTTVSREEVEKIVEALGAKF